MRVLLIRAVGIFLLLGSWGVPSPARAEERANREFQECSDCPQMVAIPAGKFIMGSPAAEPGRFDSESPQHLVSVQAFALGK
ncbi:MAG TPA: hypothetical protein VMF32_24170, partial [Xanthobacteraceae bacterium]|nr:hypothetical protein [Xanthobacteraceae bacterium]